MVHTIIGIAITLLYLGIGTFVAAMIAEENEEPSLWATLLWLPLVIFSIFAAIVWIYPMKLADYCKNHNGKREH